MSEAFLGSIIGAVSATVVVLIGGYLTFRREKNKERRLRKQEGYTNLLRYIIRVKNKTSFIDSEGNLQLEKEDHKEFYDEIAEVKIWALICSMYVSDRYKEEFKKSADELFAGPKYMISSIERTPTEAGPTIVKRNYQINDPNNLSAGRKLDMKDLDNIFNVFVAVIRKDI